LNIKNIELKTMNNKLQSEIINLKIDSEINWICNELLNIN
jgi:hypothetical protein